MEEIITDPAVTPEGNAPITFDERQQIRVNALLKTEKEKAARAAAASYESDKADYIRQIDELKKKAQPHSPAAKGGEDDPEVLKGRLEEYKSLVEAEKNNVKRFQLEAKQKSDEALTAREEARSVQKRIAMTNAATKANFFDVEDIVELQEKKIKWDADTNSFFVIGEHGQPRLNSAMEPMSLDEFFSELATKKKNWVKGNITPGLGSTPSQGFNIDSLGTVKPESVFGPKSNAKLATELKRQDPIKYAQLRKIAVAQGLLQA